MNKANYRFWVLVSIVAISGLTQGMLLPLIAVIFEKNGVSSFLNGVNATGLYIGVLIASPFMEQPLRKFGFKPIILFGGLTAMVALILFPMWKSVWFWYFLRLLIGIGDHSLNFGTQTWITDFSPTEKRGRNISLYGLFFGLGFAIGPLLTPLVAVNPALPFIISALLCFIGWLVVLTLKNEHPEQDIQVTDFFDTLKRFKTACKYAWVAFLPPLAYGFLESSLNGSFPVYALRIGQNVQNISIFLSSFSIGSIVFQLPLGMLSDRFGRRNVVIGIFFLGFIAFTLASFAEQSFFGLTACLFTAGMFVGSTFSLGISYMADLTPKNLLPTGNLLCGIFYSLGSLLGPSIGGLFIQFFQNLSFFNILSAIFLIIFLVILFKKEGPMVSVKESVNKKGG